MPQAEKTLRFSKKEPNLVLFAFLLKLFCLAAVRNPYRRATEETSKKSNLFNRLNGKILLVKLPQKRLPQIIAGPRLKYIICFNSKELK